MIQREWQRVDPKFLDDDEQRFWADDRRPPDPVRPARRLRPQVHRGPRRQGGARDVPRRLRRREPEPAAADDGARRPRRDAGRAGRLRRPRHARQPGAAVGEGPLRRRPHPAPRDRRGQGDRARPDPRAAGRGSSRARRARCRTAGRAQEFPEAKRLLGAVANSRGHRHEDNVAKLVQVARALPLAVGAALLASADGYTPRANALLDQAREELGADPGDRDRAGREPARPEGAGPQVTAARARSVVRPDGSGRTTAEAPNGGTDSRRAERRRRAPRTAPAPVDRDAPAAGPPPAETPRASGLARRATAPAACRRRSRRGRAGTASARRRATRRRQVAPRRSARRSCRRAARAPRRTRPSRDPRRRPR